MPFKNLEHKGSEVYDPTGREEVEQIKTVNNEFQKQAKERLKEDLQEAWLHPDNPMLWDGEI